ncbi:MAG: hypothetical protein CL928_18610, partial [Deltaproteobacteria bacterium]|nr:hypothetical protein [Deltaproteobacteria bacterium]
MRFRLQLLACGLLALAVASDAWAVPATFTQQGRLLDSSGQPLTGSHAVFFALYDAETGGVQRWSEYHSTAFDSGYYSVTLGELSPLTDALFSGAPLWLELEVDGITLEPRQELSAVPWALRAGTAEQVDGGVVNATEININGTQVINGAGSWVGPEPSISGLDWSTITNRPVGLDDGDDNTDTLADVGGCLSGQTIKWDSTAGGGAGAWACAEDIDTTIPDTTIPNTDLLADVGNCLAGQTIKWDSAAGGGAGAWTCAEDIHDTIPLVQQAPCDSSTQGLMYFDPLANALMVCVENAYRPIHANNTGD